MGFTWWRRVRTLYRRWKTRLLLTGFRLVKCGAVVAFSINELPIFSWRDDGVSHGPVLGGGKIGFRQMAPLVGEYANLVVRRAVVSG